MFGIAPPRTRQSAAIVVANEFASSVKKFKCRKSCESRYAARYVACLHERDGSCTGAPCASNRNFVNASTCAANNAAEGDRAEGLHSSRGRGDAAKAAVCAEVV
ncbi:MAG: hypothetical protein ACK559_16355, partial [bacterium]